MTGDVPGSVLDASALLAYLRREPGSEVVADELSLGRSVLTADRN